MQIRIRGGKVEFLRAEYSKEKKRSFQKLVKIEDLTPAEKAEFTAWENERAQAAAKAKNSVLALFGYEKIEALANAIETGFLPADPDKLLAALDRLNLALRKAKITRPPKPKTAPALDTKTESLLPQDGH